MPMLLVAWRALTVFCSFYLALLVALLTSCKPTASGIGSITVIMVMLQLLPV